MVFYIWVEFNDMKRLIVFVLVFSVVFVGCLNSKDANETDPNSAAAYFERGKEKQRLKDYNGAIADYSKVIEIDSNNASAYNRRAGLKEEFDLNGAIADYTKSYWNRS